jgi:hypothetical protein
MLDVCRAIKKIAGSLLLILSLVSVAMALGDVHGAALAAKPLPPPSHSSLEPMVPLELRFDRTARAVSAQSPSTRLALPPADGPSSGLLATQDAQALKKMDVALRTMQAQLVNSEQDVSQLRVQLKKAKSERFHNALVYVLIVWLVLALTCLATLMWPKSPRKFMDSTRWLESVMSISDRYETAFPKTVIAKPVTANHPPLAARAATGHAGMTVEALEMRDTELNKLFEESVFPATAITGSEATQVAHS